MASTKSTLSKAVIVTGGKQYLVSIGSEVSIEKLDLEVGAKVLFDTVAMAADAENILADPSKTSVEATVVVAPPGVCGETTAPFAGTVAGLLGLVGVADACPATA